MALSVIRSTVEVGPVRPFDQSMVPTLSTVPLLRWIDITASPPRWPAAAHDAKSAMPRIDRLLGAPSVPVGTGRPSTIVYRTASVS